MAGVLEGIRLIDLGAFINGVAAGYMLGDMGAEVIKIEDRERGDSLRGQVTLYGDIMSVKGRHITFEAANRNKKSITLDLKKGKGREILYQLVAKSDAFYSNYPYPVLTRLGADYETLKLHNPRLVYAHATGYGSRGPDSGLRAFDPIAQARSGSMWAMGDRDLDEPVQTVGGFFDQMGATMMAQALLAALLYRERTGKGQLVEVSLLGSAIHAQTVGITTALVRGRPQARQSRTRARNPLANYYRCADGEWLMLAEPQSDRFWAEFCQVMGLEEIRDDPRFKTAMEGRRQHYAELIQILDRTFATRSREEWLRLFKEKGASFAHSPIYRYSDLASDPQTLANDYIVEYDYPAWGKVKLPGFPIRFSAAPCRIQREAPEFGQHTEEVLNGVLGLGWEEISRLRQEEVI